MRIFYLILLIFNFISFILVGLDKKQSTKEGLRFPEAWFFFISVFFASLGVFLGMFVFRHKTHKIYFSIGIGILLIQQILLILSLTNNLHFI